MSVKQPKYVVLAVLLATSVSISGRSAADTPCGSAATQPTDCLVSSPSIPGRDAAIGVDIMDRYIVCWCDAAVGQTPLQLYARMRRFDADGTAVDSPAGVELSAPPAGTCPPTLGFTNDSMSFAMGKGRESPYVSPPAHAFWLMGKPGVFNGIYLAAQIFTFDAAPTPLQRTSCPGSPNFPAAPSAGVNDGIGGAVRSAGWTLAVDGLFGQIEGNAPVIVRSDDPSQFASVWTPCIAGRDDAKASFVWTEPDTLLENQTDIYLIQFDDDGAAVGDAGLTGVRINELDPENVALNQSSPAVAFQGDQIVVVWRGPDKTLCFGASRDRIYARRFRWGGDTNPPTDAVPLGPEFIVDEDPRFVVGGNAPANPGVAIRSSTQSGDHAFVIVWNTLNQNGTPELLTDDFNEIHAQYFDADGNRIGWEFKVSEQVGQLARSAAHTVAYSQSGQVLIAWTAGTPQDLQDVWVTALPPGYEDEVPVSCVDGDLNGDGRVNGDDIQPFVNIYVGGVSPADSRQLCAFDIDRSLSVTAADLTLFVRLLLGHSLAAADCNTNCIYDYIDIAHGTAGDCNGNDVPDECDIASSTSDDVNSNGTPDECEQGNTVVVPDCNTNGIPDADDIAGQTSADCNSNTTPDECDNLTHDCNVNGTPDDCDVAGAFPDCNTNGFPDECDNDCNESGTPDECDIAEGTSEDCNTNGYPDECDLGFGLSKDDNENLTPDECEEEQYGFGGGGGFGGEGGDGESQSEPGARAPGAGDGSGETPVPQGSSDGTPGPSDSADGAPGPHCMSPEEEAAAWDAFFAWLDAQDFTGLPGTDPSVVPGLKSWQRGYRIQRKLAELELVP